MLKMIDCFFILAIFIFFSFGHLGRISFFNQEINFYSYEILMAIFLSYLIFNHKLRPIIKFLKANRLVFFFLLFIFISFFINWPRYQIRENIIAFLYLGRVIFYWLFFVYFYFHFFQKKLKKEVERGLNIFAFLTIIFSLLQYLFYPNIRNIIYLGWDPHWYRMVGLFFDSYLAGTIFSLLAIYFFLKEKHLITLTFIIFTILTFSRNIYFSFLVVLVFYLWKNKKFKEFFFFIFFFFFIILVVPKPFGESVNLKRFFTIKARINDHQKAFSIFKKHPLMGIGYNHIGEEKIKLERVSNKFGYSHAQRGFPSSYLIVLVTTGVIGFILFFLSVKKLLFINQFSFWGGLFLAFASLFDNVFLHPMIIFLYMFIILGNSLPPIKSRRLT